MIEALVIALLALAAALVVVALASPRRAPREARSAFEAKLRRTVVVHRRGDAPSIEGVLADEWPDGSIELRHAVLLQPAEPVALRLPLNGSVLIPTGQIDFAQELEARPDIPGTWNQGEAQRLAERSKA